jgi:hypothetical protein
MEGSLVAYKVFTNGSVLQASEVNDNLMNQAVITFTNSTARASAITSPVEGMVTYLADTDTYQFWNGSAWTNLVSSTVGTGNAIINGAFEINQRNFSSTTTSASYGFDRWDYFYSSGTVTYSSQSFTPGAAPVAGYEARNHARILTSGQSGTSATAFLRQPIEDVRTFANQTVTVSFWAKAATGTPSVSIELDQQFGSGGSTRVTTLAGKVTLSTSWARYTATVAVPSISGKTIGTSSFLGTHLWVSAGSDLDARLNTLGVQNNTFDIWGVQVEAGSTATAFRRNANSLQGELAASQRYYYRNTGGGFYSSNGNGNAYSTTAAQIIANPPVTMRAAPSSVEFGNVGLGDGTNAPVAITAITIPHGGLNAIQLTATVASGLTQFRPYAILNNNNNTGFLALNAEL